MDKKTYISLVSAVVADSEILIARFGTAQTKLAGPLIKADKAGEELEPIYFTTGQKYQPIFENLFEDAVRIRQRISNLTPHRKFRRAQVHLLDALNLLGQSIRLLMQACEKMVLGDIEGTEKDMMATGDLMNQATADMEKFSSYL